MNIFYLDASPRKAAEALVDKHVVKMTTETLQLISTAHRLLDGEPQPYVNKKGKSKTRFVMRDSKLDSLLYQVTHQNHPSAVWARASSGNYEWLIQHLEAKCLEYKFRYGRDFKAVSSGLIDAVRRAPLNIPNAPFVPPTLAMPDIYKGADAVESYRRFYAGEKWRFAKWKHNVIPMWMTENMREVWANEHFAERVTHLKKAMNKKTQPADPRILQLALELTREMDPSIIS